MTSRLLALVALTAATLPGQQERGIRGRLAPEWELSKWYQLPAGKKVLDRADFRGKVVYIYCFQAWCPGCHSHGFPLLQKLTKAYAKQKDVAFVAVQTVFEGYRANTPSQVKRQARRYKLSIPFAHDAGPDGKYSWLMRAYRSGGTPWSILIDKNGVVRYDGFSSRLNEERARRMIDKLRKEKALAGRSFPAVSAAGEPFDFGARKLTLVRWCGTESPGCVISVPALADLKEQHAARGLGMLLVLDTKEDDADARRFVGQLGYDGAVAFDPGGTHLAALRKQGLLAAATHPAFLVDAKGEIVWSHPGPRLHRSEAKQDWWIDRDMRELEALVAKRLGKKKSGK